MFRKNSSQFENGLNYRVYLGVSIDSSASSNKHTVPNIYQLNAENTDQKADCNY